MDSKHSAIDYEILGYKVKLRPQEGEDAISPDDVVQLVRDTSNEILDKAPHLSRGEVALLVALSMAQDKLSLENEFKADLEQLKRTAGDALQFIEEVSPSMN